MTHPARATYDAHMAQRQDRFLAVYAEFGNIPEAALVSNVSDETVRLWERDNDLGFAQRFQRAKRAYAEYLEQLARKRVQAPSFNGRIGSDVLLLGLLNANWPEKYRPNVTITHDLGRRVMDLIAKAQARDELAEGRVVEADTPGGDQKTALPTGLDELKA